MSSSVPQKPANEIASDEQAHQLPHPPIDRVGGAELLTPIEKIPENKIPKGGDTYGDDHTYGA